MTENGIILSLPKFDNDDVAKGMDNIFDRLDVNLEKIEKWFKQFSIDSMEVYITGVIETGGITKLVVSAKAEGGIKIVLRPKTKFADRAIRSETI